MVLSSRWHYYHIRRTECICIYVWMRSEYGAIHKVIWNLRRAQRRNKKRQRTRRNKKENRMNEIMPNKMRGDSATTPMRLSLLFPSWIGELQIAVHKHIDKTHRIPKTGYVADYSPASSTPLPSHPHSFFVSILCVFDASNSRTFIHFRIVFFACSIFRRLLRHLCGADWKTVPRWRRSDSSTAGNKSNSKQTSAKKEDTRVNGNRNRSLCRKRFHLQTSLMFPVVLFFILGFGSGYAHWASVKRKREIYVFIAQSAKNGCEFGLMPLGSLPNPCDWRSTPRTSFKVYNVHRGRVFISKQQVSLALLRTFDRKICNSLFNPVSAFNFIRRFRNI